MLLVRAPLRTRLAVLNARGLATVVRDPKSFSIPVINFAKFRSNSEADKKQTADDIVTAFKESGFVYLEGHGIPSGACQSLGSAVTLISRQKPLRPPLRRSSPSSSFTTSIG